MIVVRGLPDSKWSSGRLEVGEAVPAPELLLIDAVAPLDFAVLLRASGRMYRWRIPESAGFGLFLVYRIGFVGGLFTGEYRWTPQ